MALPKRVPPAGGGVDQGPPWGMAEWENEYPCLRAFLLDTTYADGSNRRPGSISLFTQWRSLKAAINDKDRQLVAFVTAPTMSELLFAIEEGIRTDNIGWKATPNFPPNKTPTY